MWAMPTKPAEDPIDAAAKSTAFKDNIDAALVRRLAAATTSVWPGFPSERFVTTCTDGLDGLELKARIAHVAAGLQRCLPEKFTEAAAVVDAVLELPPSDDVDGPGGLSGWDLWPLQEWIALIGRAEPDVALELMARLTRYASGEFAIRPFIDDDPAGCLERFEGWIRRDDEHVRRLVSEGTRPKLPWAPRLATADRDPSYAVALLDRLVDDDAEYVRRSVSNHLNDLCRVAPLLALEAAGRWNERAVAARDREDEPTASKLDWVIRRGLRTLVKAGDRDAMRLLGHDPDVAVRAMLRISEPTVNLGGHAAWTVELVSEEPTPTTVVLDYAIHFVRANGSAGRKVFKWTTVQLEPGERRTLVRRHRIAPVTVRNYFAGHHVVQVQVNGAVVAEGGFDLVL